MNGNFASLKGNCIHFSFKLYKITTYRVSFFLVIYLGLVAQWIRARGYELRCQGFESLHAQYTSFLLLIILFWGVAKW
jgi:hypothetical protein